MLLVDSSVWIDLHRNVETEATRFLQARDEYEELAVTGVIVQEVLQGAVQDRVFNQLRGMFGALPSLAPDRLQTYEHAADLFRRARKAGFTIRKPTDCLIAALALEHEVMLVHNDRDFQFLALVDAGLMIYPGRPH